MVLGPSGDIKWHAGPLTEAIVKGYFFLADELNLADPSIISMLKVVLDTSPGLLQRQLRHHTINPYLIFNLIISANFSSKFTAVQK